MEISLIDHIAMVYYGDLQIDGEAVNQITRNTVETWQPNRREDERGNNTQQGKVAEEIVEQFIYNYFPTSISIKSYDEIRNDNFEKHAPFDFIIWETGTADIELIEYSIQNDIINTPDQFVRLSEYTRKLCKQYNVKIAEVKSTKIRETLKTKAGFNGNYDDQKQVMKLINEIKCTDDVFCYPYFKRSEIAVEYSMIDYCQYVRSQEPSLSEFQGEQLRRKVIDLEITHQCCDVFIRVYIDLLAKRGFIIGWIQRERLLDYAVRLKRMRQKNKSERALYFAKNLKEIIGIDLLQKLFDRREQVYASPFTRTNFYHKSKECKYIRNVSSDDLIVFKSEDAAVANGRYINRCNACFNVNGGYNGKNEI